MNIYEFISSIIASIIWPSVFITFILVFKESLSKVLFSLSKIRYGELEVDLSKEIKEISNVIEATTLIDEIDEVDSEVDSYQKINNISKGKNKDDQITELEPIAYTFPDVAIAKAWGEIIGEINNLLLRINKYTSSLNLITDRDKLNILRNERYIDEETFNILERMFRVRNTALASNINNNATIVEALEYLKATQKIIVKLRSNNTIIREYIVSKICEKYPEYRVIPRNSGKVTVSYNTQFVDILIKYSKSHNEDYPKGWFGISKAQVSNYDIFVFVIYFEGVYHSLIVTKKEMNNWIVDKKVTKNNRILLHITNIKEKWEDETVNFNLTNSYENWEVLSKTLG